MHAAETESRRKRNSPGRPWLLLVLSLWLFFGLWAMRPPEARSAQATVAWDHTGAVPAAGYRLYYGFSSRNYSFVVDVGDRKQYTLKGLEKGRIYYVAATACDNQGNESAFSGEIVINLASGATPQPAVMVDPAEGTEGTEFVISGAGFGEKRGKIRIGGRKCKVLSWNDSQIHSRIMGGPKGSETQDQFRLGIGLQPEPIAPGRHSIRIRARGARRIVLESAFVIRAPQILGVTPAVGAAQDEVEIQGLFFGVKKGKVICFNDDGKRKRCRVLSWNMEPLSGASSIRIAIPRGFEGPVHLTVKNSIAKGTLKNGFHIQQ